ncbi:G-protein coupled receptor dmsr-1-like [Gigantopelta aegis]|uniref:G-protein coupled receptor dmsr-1-like n=1 Tax=Gigantopelta aegis TaxID=1735272 RepID=UPI001B88AFF3|nr:G-protein coupled receptor dmsr-1-like [Gigantopelta aegis]
MESNGHDVNASYHDDAVSSASGLMLFSQWFSSVHGYASVIVSIFGVFTNIFNITILSRRDMRTPTNILLTCLAVSDILTMVPYIPFAIHFYCPPASPFETPWKFTYSWIMYMLFMVNITATTHTISIWLGVSLAVFRFVQMRSTSRGPLAKERRINQAKVISLIVCVVSSLVLIPNYMTNELEVHTLPDNTTYYVIKDLKLATNETKEVVLINVVTYAVIAKVVPCFLMIVFSGSLVYTLSLKGRSRRRRLANTGKKSKKDSRQTTTTRMLLVVIVLFLLTEFPQGVLILASASIPGFYLNVYWPLGDLMDFVALVNNAINFVLYCIMSQQFRARFFEMYLRRTVTLKPLEESMTTERMYLKEPATKMTSTG